MAVPSSVGLESTTDVSFSLQKGQSMIRFYLPYIGKEEQRSMISFCTSFSILELFSLLELKPFITLKIKSATNLNSSGPKPLVVHAGVPSLIQM